MTSARWCAHDRQSQGRLRLGDRRAARRLALNTSAFHINGPGGESGYDGGAAPVVPTKIELVDDQGDPMPYQHFELTTADGIINGITGADGKAEVDDVEGVQSIIFLDLDEVKPG